MKTEPSAPFTVFVVDDEEPVRDALTLLFKSASLTVESFASGPAFLQRLVPSDAGAAVVDIKMPGMSGLEVFRRVQELGHSISFIFVTGHGDVPMAVEALKLGAFDFFEKPFDDRRLLASVQEAQRRDRSVRDLRTHRKAVETAMATLTPREKEVLDLIVSGASNKGVARQLDISPRTVENHRAHVMEKMGAQSLSELIRMVLELR